MRLLYWVATAVFWLVAAASLVYWGTAVVIAFQGIAQESAVRSPQGLLASAAWIAGQAVVPGLACLLLWKLSRAARNRLA